MVTAASSDRQHLAKCKLTLAAEDQGAPARHCPVHTVHTGVEQDNAMLFMGLVYEVPGAAAQDRTWAAPAGLWRPRQVPLETHVHLRLDGPRH